MTSTPPQSVSHVAASHHRPALRHLDLHSHRRHSLLPSTTALCLTHRRTPCWARCATAHLARATPQATTPATPLLHRHHASTPSLHYQQTAAVFASLID
ncbi:hypothetical protein U1Q18_019592 [Sarracenia purpurea var. burkii]